ncbi:protein serine/threonine phosphatase 2C [Penicillium angulare]|uniref:Protein serine/threonine phosphatase 2C n=1 Tax=Penicillium angulare TaxID=116970 RepID=A0A9W9K0D8_9EURO|nr:protein serine/threonine phosphatase 2C [Penicillium angulare]
MLLGTARTRLRVSTAPSLRARAKYSYSTKGAGPSSFSNLMRYIKIAGVVGTPALWWLVTTGRSGTTRDDAPHLESPPGEHWSVEPGPSKDQVTRIISQGAYSFWVRNVRGVSRYDGAQLASNSPCEDEFTHGKIPSPWGGNHWMAWGVFDGHAGGQTAELLKNQLLPFVQYNLGQIKLISTDESAPQESVQRAIMKGFKNLDDSIIKTAMDTSESQTSLQEKVKKLAPAYSGSCALLSLYDSTAGMLHVACTGDSRAVLGQQIRDGSWEAIPLSVDQNSKNEEEMAGLHKEHPGEENIVGKKGRILGLTVSRAFGDCQWKWPIEFHRDIQRRFYGPQPLVPTYDVLTPPYLTAEPVVTSTKIDPENPSFLIMATDGLWDMLSSQQAVNLVGKWLESETAEKTSNEQESTYESFDFGDFWKGISWKFTKGRTTVQDDNAAVHLVRNSLGGNHHELIAGRLAFTYPSARRLRDDTTVQVVFFNTLDLKHKH